MDIKKWEPTIEQILVETIQQQKESGKQKVLTAWRAKLEQEPTNLKLYQIDEVVREVRRRLNCLAKSA